MMELHRMSEKFEAWLPADDVALVHQHMVIARMRKKSEYTRAALLAGLPRYDFEQDWRVGELALAVNRLVTIMATENPPDELAQVCGNVKRLTRTLQHQRARERDR